MKNRMKRERERENGKAKGGRNTWERAEEVDGRKHLRFPLPAAES